MLELSHADFIGKGRHRKCYIHPHNPDLCIKVIYAKGGATETRREVKYYRHLQARLNSWQILPQFYGKQETNLGMGYVFELIRDFDGQISTSLETYLASEELTEQHFSGLKSALAQLKQQLLLQGIITMTLKPKNILYRQKEFMPGNLFIIDNIGNSTLLPIANYSRFFAQLKVKRLWRSFIRRILHENPNNTVLTRLLENEVD